MNRIAALDYIRAIAMCGVLMIHTGSYALGNTAISPAYIAFLEILTRFSIPVFFFVSAFGLFAGYKPEKPFSYRSFLGRRMKSVAIPYIVWSAIYTIVARDFSGLLPQNFLWKLFFGLGSYQLYFIAILIWFYILMPLWRLLIPRLSAKPLLSTVVLFALQIAVNHISVQYLWNIKTGQPLIDALVGYRVNYWVVHYLFIFIFGGICALHKDAFGAFCSKYRQAITLFFIAAAANICGWYYWYQACRGYTMLDCINTLHQLSLPGLVYTFAATLFLYSQLSRINSRLLRRWADNSFTVYLVHPLFMYLLSYLYTKMALTFTILSASLFFCAALFLSLLFSGILNKITARFPAAGLLLKGSQS